jgi:hypothetical protein
MQQPSPEFPTPKPTIDTIAPLHHNAPMRLTVNLDPDLYAIAKAVAQSEDCSISAAVGRLIRRGLAPANGLERPKQRTRSGIAVSRGRIPVTAELVRRSESEDDAL